MHRSSGRDSEALAQSSASTKMSIEKKIDSPLAMKLFATLYSDRTPNYCVARLCCLKMDHLQVISHLDSDMSSFIVAVKLQSSRRILRSHEIELPSNGLIDTGIDLSFSLEYPHFMKRAINILHVCLQRKRRYKSKTMLGFRTLAIGVIDLDEVLQNKPKEYQIELLACHRSNSKNKQSANTVAKIHISSLSSQPVQIVDVPSNEEKTQTEETTMHEDGALGASEEDELSSDGSADSEIDAGPLKHGKRFIVTRQRNLKQKLQSLMKRFGKSDDAGEDPEAGEIDELLDDLDYFSGGDSDVEKDTISVMSTPKPSLRPYFTTTECSADKSGDDNGEEFGNGDEVERIPRSWTESSGANRAMSLFSGSSFDCDVEGPGAKVRKKSNLRSAKIDKLRDVSKTESRVTIFGSSNVSKDEGKVGFMEAKQRGNEEVYVEYAQSLSAFASKASEAEAVPARQEVLARIRKIVMQSDKTYAILADSSLPAAKRLISAYMTQNEPVIGAHSQDEISSFMRALLSQKLQRDASEYSKNRFSLVLIGGDEFINAVLRLYVSILSEKPAEWLLFLKFIPLPVEALSYTSTACRVAQFMSSIDEMYSSLFSDRKWKEMLMSSESSVNLNQDDSALVVKRTKTFLESAASQAFLPISQVVLSIKASSDDMTSNQKILPFISELRIDVRRMNDINSTNYGVSSDLPNFDSHIFEEPVASSPPKSSTLPSNFDPHALSLYQQGTISSPAQKLVNQSPPGSPRVSAKQSSDGLNTTDVAQKSYDNGSGGKSIQQQTHLTSSLSGSVALEPQSVELHIEFWSPHEEKEGKRGKSVSESLNFRKTVQHMEENANAAGSNANAKLVKSSLKNTLCAVLVTKMYFAAENADMFSSNAPINTMYSTLFRMLLVSREKKQKLMRIGKKLREKDYEVKTQTHENVHRIICSVVSKQQTMKVLIDNVEWTNVKFFQLSQHWSSQVKTLPLAVSSNYREQAAFNN